MGCELYGASNLQGHKGLCRANPGTAYGPKDDKPGAVFTQKGAIVPDPTLQGVKPEDQPWGAFIGETLRACDPKHGYYEIADSGPKGATFDKKSANVVRKFPNMSKDRVMLSAFGGKAGTLCIKADQPSIREGIIRTIRGGEDWYNPFHWFDGDCPKGLSGQQCDALASSMAQLRPPSQNHLMEFFFLIAAFTIGPDIYHGIKNRFKKGKGDGDGNGSGNGGGGSVDDIIRAYHHGVMDAKQQLSQETSSEFISALTPVSQSSMTLVGAYTQINGQWYAISDEALNPPLVLVPDHPAFKVADALHAIAGKSWRMETNGAAMDTVQLTEVTASTSTQQSALAAVGIAQGHAGLVDFVNVKSDQFSPSDAVAFTIQGSGLKVFAGAGARTVGGRVVAAPTFSIRIAPVTVTPPVMVPAL